MEPSELRISGSECYGARSCSHDCVSDLLLKSAGASVAIARALPLVLHLLDGAVVNILMAHASFGALLCREWLVTADSLTVVEILDPVEWHARSRYWI